MRHFSAFLSEAADSVFHFLATFAGVEIISALLLAGLFLAALGCFPSVLNSLLSGRTPNSEAQFATGFGIPFILPDQSNPNTDGKPRGRAPAAA